MAETQDFALIGEDGSVLNRIVVAVDGEGQPAGYEPEEAHALVPDPDGLARIGGRWTGAAFEAPAELDPAPAEAPLTITRGQLETLLSSLGYTPEQIAAAIAAAAT